MITNGYLTTADAQDYIGRQFADSTGLLDDLVTVASRSIDRHCGRHFYTVTATRIFDTEDGYTVRFGAYNDLVSVTTLRSDSTGDGVYDQTWTANQYQLQPVGATTRAPVAEPFTSVALLDGLTFPWRVSTRRQGLIEIAGVWGWPTEPPIEIRQACRLLVHEFAKLVDAPFGMLGSAEFGMSRIPPTKQRHVRDLLGPFMHPAHHSIG